MPAVAVVLLPLDMEILRTRLGIDDFRLTRSVGGKPVSLHFGPEFPGDALALYPSLLEAAGKAGSVEGSFIVIDSSSGEVVGQIGSLGAPEGDEVEIGYGINASAHGRGIATTSVALLIDALRKRPGVGRIVARTAVANPASGRVLEKNCFVVTGRASSDEGELLSWTHTG
ncbi:MAG: GNAT family protein [Ilumatobacteraceae bacterium]